MSRGYARIATLWLLTCAVIPVYAQKHAHAAKHKLSRDQIGLASWYGAEWNGHETASGEKFRPSRLTAASPTLPLGSIIQVTNLRNGKQVRLLVNDRGPSHPGRILDVSRAAARVLGFIERGVTRVRVHLLQAPSEDMTAALQP